MDRILHLMRFLLAIISCLLVSPPVWATITQSHGYAQFGNLKYPSSFTHFDWVNPRAPKGGRVRLMASGTFDTLNPYTFKGTSPSATPGFFAYGISEMNEPLMVGSGIYDPSGDEPTSSYGLIAESVEYSDNFSWVVFNLRDEARFHDGKAITAYDVAFSYRVLRKEGHPQFRTNLKGVKRVDILNRHRIRFVFERPDPLLISRLGELPVLPQHYWKGKDFRATTFEPPLGSGPYRIAQVVPGRRLVFERVKNWWGKDLPVNRGKYNFDRVEVEFYRDDIVAFEAFKVGEFDFYIEHQAKNWATAYEFPAVTRGDVIRAEIPHQIPTQTQALFMNSRRAIFNDRRVRQALGLLFDFEWTNRALFYGATGVAKATTPTAEFAATGLPEGGEWLGPVGLPGPTTCRTVQRADRISPHRRPRHSAQDAAPGTRTASRCGLEAHRIGVAQQARRGTALRDTAGQPAPRANSATLRPEPGEGWHRGEPAHGRRIAVQAAPGSI